ncbi:MAG: hypothetical protein HYU37_01685 [Acidobacteria bacterium]|nr:hypothetical protein [Acidobacteriota bacterium]
MRCVGAIVLAAVVFAGCADRPADPVPQGETPQASESIPRLPDGKPDLAEARAQQAKLVEADDPLFRCMPYGVPRSILSSPWPFQIVHRQGMMVVLTEYYHAFRLIPTDGSPHPPDVLPTYFGDSIGRWDGDTLVVDIVGFNDKTWLADARDRPTPTSTGIWLHSDALHVTERWRLADADTLEYQATVEDPKMLTRPWTSPVKTVKRQPFGKIGEGMCFDTTTYALARPAAQSAGR